MVTLALVVSGGAYRPECDNGMAPFPTRIEVLAFVKAFFLFHMMQDHLGGVHTTYGDSMLPRLDGSFVMVDKLFWRWNLGGGPKGPLGVGIGVGDVVIGTRPDVAGRHFCKRIVGMPGDVICRDPLMSRREYIKVD